MLPLGSRLVYSLFLVKGATLEAVFRLIIE
jgi:hypothetical protein